MGAAPSRSIEQQVINVDKRMLRTSRKIKSVENRYKSNAKTVSRLQARMARVSSKNWPELQKQKRNLENKKQLLALQLRQKMSQNRGTVTKTGIEMLSTPRLAPSAAADRAAANRAAANRAAANKAAANKAAANKAAANKAAANKAAANKAAANKARAARSKVLLNRLTGNYYNIKKNAPKNNFGLDFKNYPKPSASSLPPMFL